jgi:tRNA/tmRNA/rRNA uracil-C5-methylase (TrmA/RlmC/RlmD family)
MDAVGRDRAVTLDLDVTGVAHGGVFVARHEGRVVFVPDAIPGERVRVRVEDAGAAAATKSFWRAETLEVQDASPDRRPHVWPEADISRAPEQRPGGADFGHITLGRQRALKAEVLSDALRRFAGLTRQTTVEPAGDAESEDGTGWRTRLSLHVDDAGTIGPFGARSHRVVPVSSHPLAHSALAEAALSLAGLPSGRVDLVLPADGRVRVIPRPEQPPRSRAAPRGRGSDRRRRPARPAAPAEPRQAREVLVERAAGRDFRVDAGGFWQVHRLAADTLSDAVATALAALGFDPAAANLDLYGGVGLFAAVIGAHGGPSTRITTVESAPDATAHAGENLAEWVGSRAVTARVDRYLAQMLTEATAVERARWAGATVVLDPPRAGAGAGVVDALGRMRPRSIVYVACDPVALARDVGLFAAAGYALTGLRAFDLFPNSHHLEAVAVLERAA